MPEIDPTTLRRKAGAGRPPPDHGVITVPGALRLAIAKAGQDTLGIKLAVEEVGEARATLDSMTGHLPEGGLTVHLRGRGGAAGLLALDPSLLAAVLQARTTGRVTGTEVPERAPTQTDATLARGFLAAFLDSFADRLSGKRDAEWAAGFKPRERLADTGRLPFLMRDVPYRALDIGIDIASGLRRGHATLILPQSAALPAVEMDAEMEEEAASTAAPLDAAPWRAALGARVMESEALLEAVVHTWEFPLARLASMKPGELLTFPRNATASVRLTARDGTVVAAARLGQSQGYRAVKLVETGGAETLGALAHPGAGGTRHHVAPPRADLQAAADDGDAEPGYMNPAKEQN
jgi:flagellar motor switch protein FliM